MITSLSKLTMRKYIELVCGDTSALIEQGEVVPESKLIQLRQKLILEYAQLSDSTGSKILLAEQVDRYRATMELTFFQCLNNALITGAQDEVRALLKEYGKNTVEDGKELVMEVSRLLKRAKTNVKRYENQQASGSVKEPGADEIRTQFDRQAASLMTYFKFQIDFDTISASQFACMTDQAQKQIKAKMAAMNKNK